MKYKELKNRFENGDDKKLVKYTLKKTRQMLRQLEQSDGINTPISYCEMTRMLVQKDNYLKHLIRSYYENEVRSKYYDHLEIEPEEERELIELMRPRILSFVRNPKF